MSGFPDAAHPQSADPTPLFLHKVVALQTAEPYNRNHQLTFCQYCDLNLIHSDEIGQADFYQIESQSNMNHSR